MFNISNNDIITMTRGDSAITELCINLGSELSPIIYDLGAEDKVYLGVCEPNKPWEAALIKKVFTAADYNYEQHTLRIAFKSKDTEFVLPGVYYYSIKLYRPSLEEIEYNFEEESGAEEFIQNEFTTAEKIDTIIDRKKFIILE